MKSEVSVFSVVLIMRALMFALVLSLLVSPLRAVVTVENLSHIPTEQLKVSVRLANQTNTGKNAGALDPQGKVTKRAGKPIYNVDFPYFDDGRYLSISYTQNGRMREYTLLGSLWRPMYVSHGENYQLITDHRSPNEDIFLVNNDPRYLGNQPRAPFAPRPKMPWSNS